MKTTKNSLTIATVIVAIALVSTVSATPGVRADHRVRVDFSNPENFTDVRDSAFSESDSRREFVLSELREFIQNRGEKLLSEGLQLEIRVTDIDLSGDFEPWHDMRFNDIRIIKSIYPARVTLEFKLTDSTGKVLAEGTRKLSDFGYPSLSSIAFTSDSLRYEKDLVGSWLNSEFRAYRKA